MAKAQEDKGSTISSAARGVGMMVLAIVSFLLALWVIMAIVRLFFG